MSSERETGREAERACRQPEQPLCPLFLRRAASVVPRLRRLPTPAADQRAPSGEKKAAPWCDGAGALPGSERPRTSALLSAFLSKWSRNLTDFVGQRHWVVGAPGVFFACACRPMQPLKKRNGTACFFSSTSSR